ncbi:hypothetical protein FA95DRAFT_951270 [Auriscalpium vulgare]|uniref:Uncharacterized protein n=1 Tax=Auriscalpium vulgare TaxID=40419 RepID=A0ACB8RZ79_9AGAM|nr:hypothetical protein FA95DRAFT_951270 [Auriscalpium vulgare]
MCTSHRVSTYDLHAQRHLFPASVRRRAMAKLPLELQIAIIECVYRLSQAEAVDYATLCACALVCRAWTPIAQRLLFRRVPSADLQFDGSHALPLLLRTLRTSPHLSAAVRSIFLSVFLANATSDISDDVEILELCPHVQNIIAQDILDGPAMFPALEARLCAIKLRSVALRTWGDPSFAGLFLRAWPDLHTLDLEGMYPSEAPDALISASGALQVLSLNAEHVPWALAQKNDFTALRDFELLGPTWYEDGWIQQLLGSGIFRGILTLRLDGSFPPQDVLDRIVRLESLVFNELPAKDVVLPKSLRHVGYHPWNTSNSPEGVKVASYVVAGLRALADLKLVTATRLAQPAQLTALEDVCRDRGVEFETYQTPHHSANPRWDVDWI